MLTYMRTPVHLSCKQQGSACNHVQPFNLLLLCAVLCSAVLLVDSSRAGWPILHANAACQQLVQQLCDSSQQQRCSTTQQRPRMDDMPNTTSSGSSSSVVPPNVTARATQRQQQQQSSSASPREVAAAAPAGATVGGQQAASAQPSPRFFASCSDNTYHSSSSNVISGSSIVGKYIKDMLDPLQIAYMQSTAPCSGNGTMSQSMFLPHLPGLGGGGVGGMPGVSAAAAAAAAGWPPSFRQRVMLQTQVRLTACWVLCSCYTASVAKSLRQD
jgi:hypothetical protein